MTPTLRSVPRTHEIKWIVIHYTATHHVFNAFRALTSRRLSAHWLISSDYCSQYPYDQQGPLLRDKATDPIPSAIRCVHDNRCAFHAGGSTLPDGGPPNQSSIGIEITNFGFSDFGNPLGQKWLPKGEKDLSVKNSSIRYRKEPGRSSSVSVGANREWITDKRNRAWAIYDESQYITVADICAEAIQRYNLDLLSIIGHDHIDKRKSDPGFAFDWNKLYGMVSAKLSKEKVVSSLANQGPDRVQLAQFHCNRILNSKLKLDGINGPKTQSAIREAITKYPNIYNKASIPNIEDFFSNKYALSAFCLNSLSVHP